LAWVHATIGIGAKQIGRTMGVSMIAVLGVILLVGVIAMITLPISYALRRRAGRNAQPDFVQRAAKQGGDPDFLKKARERQAEQDGQGGSGGRAEPEFVREAREKQKGRE